MWVIGRMRTLLCLLAMLPLISIAEQPVPPVNDFTLRTLQGPNLRLQEQRGKWVLLHFWAGWCPVCAQALPDFWQWREQFTDKDLVVWGLNLDNSHKIIDHNYVQRAPDMPVLLDQGGTVAQIYDIDNLPAIILIDPDGREFARWNEYDETIRQQIDNQLREQIGRIHF